MKKESPPPVFRHGLYDIGDDVNVPLMALTPAAQWNRVAAIVQLSLSRVDRVNSTQSLARQQLDVAEYALQAMIEDLQTVMPSMRFIAHS